MTDSSWMLSWKALQHTNSCLRWLRLTNYHWSWVILKAHDWASNWMVCQWFNYLRSLKRYESYSRCFLILKVPWKFDAVYELWPGMIARSWETDSVIECLVIRKKETWVWKEKKLPVRGSDLPRENLLEIGLLSEQGRYLFGTKTKAPTPKGNLRGSNTPRKHR